MLDLLTLGAQIAAHRRSLKLSQSALAERARVSRATLDALENGRTGEIGFSKINRILTALGLEVAIQPARPRRPTLDELLQEDRDDQSLGRRR